MKPQGLKSPPHQVSYKSHKRHTMANEIVKYANQLNTMDFNSLSTNQQDILFTFFSLFKESENDRIVISFDDLIDLAQLDKSKSNTKYLNELLDKLKDLQSFCYRYEPNERQIIQEVIFPKIILDKEKRELIVEISKAFKTMYLACYKEFTRFYLKEFVTLPSTYTKTIYRNLRQFQSTGVWSVSYDEFKKLLGIPSGYRATDINRQILEPTKKILSEDTLFDTNRVIFENLEIYKNKKGRKIESLDFIFKPIDKSKEQKAKELKATFEKAKNERERELQKANDFFKSKWLKFENKKDPTRNQHEPQRYGLIQKIFFDDERKKYAYTFLAYFKKPAQINSNFEAETTIHYDDSSDLIYFLKSHLID